MSSIKTPLGTRPSKKSTPIQFKIKTEPNIYENLSKKRKDIDSAPEKVRNEADEPKSCPQCHRNLLVVGTERNPCPVCCNRDNATLKGSNGPTDLQDQLTDVAAGEGTNTTHGLTNHQLGALEPVRMWLGNEVGQPVKQLLQAVEQCYPSTFQELQIIPEAYRSSSLIQLHDFIKRFLETPVNGLEEDKLISLEAELSFFGRFGFDLSWARKRVNMVRLLKFGNDPLRLRLVEANARFDQARLEYERATDVRNRMLHEVAQRVGAEFEGVLNGDLGFGMLPRY